MGTETLMCNQLFGTMLPAYFLDSEKLRTAIWCSYNVIYPTNNRLLLIGSLNIASYWTINEINKTWTLAVGDLFLPGEKISGSSMNKAEVKHDGHSLIPFIHRVWHNVLETDFTAQECVLSLFFLTWEKKTNIGFFSCP